MEDEKYNPQALKYLVQAQHYHTLCMVVKWLQENGAVLNGVFCLPSEKWQELKDMTKNWAGESYEYDEMGKL